jgi:hypothetical protein
MTVDAITEIIIDRPVDEVAEFAGNPTNTPRGRASQTRASQSASGVKPSCALSSGTSVVGSMG